LRNRGRERLVVRSGYVQLNPRVGKHVRTSRGPAAVFKTEVAEWRFWLLGQVEQRVSLLSGAAITQQINFQRRVENYGQSSGEVPDLPDLAVGQDDPLNALVDGVHLDLAQVPGAELGRAALDFDESDELLGDADPVVGELSLDLVFGGEVFVFVVSQALAQEVRNQQPGVTFTPGGLWSAAPLVLCRG
jgi:hypothetical protein